MLPMQVSYWTLVETKRHNEVSEDVAYKNLNEVVRHNVASEQENYRHNVATEEETHRHNVATEDYYNNVLQETQRHNVASEQLEAYSLEIRKMDAMASQINAATNRMNADTNAKNAVTNAYNAITNRRSVDNSYNLGLDANRIASENAETQSRSADIRWLEWTSRDKSTDVDSRNADTNALNAMTNITNAESRQSEVNLGYDNLNFQREKFKWQKFTDTSELGIKAANTVNDVMSNIMKYQTK